MSLTFNLINHTIKFNLRSIHGKKILQFSKIKHLTQNALKFPFPLRFIIFNQTLIFMNVFYAQNIFAIDFHFIFQDFYPIRVFVSVQDRKSYLDF